MAIAIVDDTPLNLTLIQALVRKLTPPGTEIVTFSSPLEGLQWCGSHEPDLVIVDYMMPDLNGIEFIETVRKLYPADTVPILMVTAAHEKEVRYESLAAGANDFLTKPIDRHEFDPRVRTMLSLRASHQRMRTWNDDLQAAVILKTAEIVTREQETITRLARAAEFRDPETGAHILRMAHYSQIIARDLGLDAETCERILTAAPMHDIGKVGTPDNILLKPGRLTPEEMVIMRQHPRIGHDILKGSSSPMIQMAAEIALTHHEKYDGSGYPDGLAGDAIPLVGRIVAVADVFDALTSPRPYKPAWELDTAFNFIREGRGSHFDPACVDSFLGLIPEVLEIRERFKDE
ncbi:HD domain-containing phosphohydrolase [Zoogloea oryzae]|uniref:Two-component system response regulator n=1 Tax=Zoogloea oryzae TaxID=310767 RepID=A0ABQ6FAR7_9RHOO|nr:HD domain-containing phosphohydrolase [Zoogloea oryzae]GLT22627.1 two-component system response regulator [Zoogloea oryzae]